MLSGFSLARKGFNYANPVCLITGVGDSTGSSLSRRFTAGDYRVAMIARNADRLKALEKELPDSRAYICDVGNLETLLSTVKEIQVEMGLPSVLVHNAVSHIEEDIHYRVEFG